MEYRLVDPQYTVHPGAIRGLKEGSYVILSASARDGMNSHFLTGFKSLDHAKKRCQEMNEEYRQFLIDNKLVKK